MKYSMKYILPASFCLASCMSAQNSEKPNILFILADDLGWNDLSCTGSIFYETPHIDRIAHEGALFINGYAACQVSSPSRASILTGKTPARHGITNWIGELSGEDWRKMNRHSKLLPAEYVHSLPHEEITLPETLRENGYTTFMAGKWHLGGTGSEPEAHGFDINIGGYESGSPRGGYFSPYNNPKLPDGPAGENLSMRLANETIHFITNHTENNKETPFFAYLSFYAVHGPIQTTEERWNYYRDKAEQQGIESKGFYIDRTLPVRRKQDNPVYAGLIAQMDDAVGTIMNKLTELGLDENTIIIFTSDNGGVSSGDDFSSSCYPLRGGKGRQWEGGLRVPVLIKYPGRIESGTQIELPATGMDFYPTLLDYAGLAPLPTQHMDGISLKPLLSGVTIPERALYWHYPHYGNQGGEPSSIIRDGDWKLIWYHEDSRYELYNLKQDQSESEPLNVQYPTKLKELSAKLNQWLSETGARMPHPDMEYDPQEEAKYKQTLHTIRLQQVEHIRNEQLRKDWSPNENWWNSKVTID